LEREKKLEAVALGENVTLGLSVKVVVGELD